ncbi:uncharacterized protein LOC115587269 [Sparus aurata]|uniref:uncharacterized protein LOC115587269 n=1 Tax=Sparus aurata TaxID=8175 RepID=UPI0011C0DC49|nr:uncharacterized protein LOC115587269 [Sparus aurata]
MSLEDFWPQSFDNMGRTRGNKDKKDVPTEPDGDTQDGDQAEFAAVDGLDPGFAKALSVMTSYIIKVIDDKLSPLVETIYKNTTEIQAACKWLDEAEARLLAVENSAETQEPRIVELEKQVSALTESLDMAENYSRRLNIRVVGLPEDTETGQPVEFFESWLPRVLKMTTKAGRIKLERAHRTLAPKPDPNRSPRSVLLRFPGRGLNLQWSQGLFLQRFLLDGDKETQGIRCGETAAARARVAVCYAVSGYSTGDTRELQKEVFHTGGGTRLH